MNEKYYNIKGYEDYKVTKSGKIYSNLTLKELKPEVTKQGYLKVTLMDRRIGRPIKLLIHRIVALQFIPNPRNLPEVNHKDGNKKNNSIYNLEWCTSEYNRRHAIETGLYKKEEDNPRAKLTREQVKEIHRLGSLKSKKEIASMYNVSDSLIGEILRGVRWSSVYKELYGKSSDYKKLKRKKISLDTIKYIFKSYYLDNKSTTTLERELNISNAYIGKILRGIVYEDVQKECVKEIRKLLGNQQPNL